MTRTSFPPRFAAALAALALLAACGADGAPLRPDGARTGVSFSGEGRFGVTTE